jgi:hypothetical protein
MVRALTPTGEMMNACRVLVGRIILKGSYRNMVETWPALLWLTIKTSGGLLWTRQWNF